MLFSNVIVVYMRGEGELTKHNVSQILQRSAVLTLCSRHNTIYNYSSTPLWMEFPTYLMKQKYNTLDNIPNVDVIGKVIDIDICTIATLHSNVPVPSTLDVITKIDKILVHRPHITPLNMYA